MGEGEGEGEGRGQGQGQGEGVWHAPAGEYVYLHFDLDAIEYDLAAALGQ